MYCFVSGSSKLFKILCKKFFWLFVAGPSHYTEQEVENISSNCRVKKGSCPRIQFRHPITEHGTSFFVYTFQREYFMGRMINLRVIRCVDQRNWALFDRVQSQCKWSHTLPALIIFQYNSFNKLYKFEFSSGMIYYDTKSFS